ncbi:hypothetical protein SAMN05660860_02720 [Geoalkalibacter ferrihydriticus]|uniref:AhpC/TSA family protein n=1 Tax=Geoalkalibacter ferrihydriticus TaxID=392333 RepID=A0A1G9U5E2_9BACT|nr:hypothetical protein [Geoalkalibacter ferrihydriticus]SDM54864.1 hypothetical protein SAMN05660860_02720 [Geoalkalibacter ferrihydriticus]
MTLQSTLKEIKSGFQEKADAESQKIMGRAARALAESGIVERALREGDAVPEFTLNAADGRRFDSQKLLAEGPLVMNFFRGAW